MKVICSYCDRPAQLVTGKTLYPRRVDLFHKYFWYCKPCVAYVGCHPGSKQPLGRLANAELRRWKQRTHEVFDPLWRGGAISRSEAYGMLASAMGIAKQNCHIGMFGIDECKAAIAILEGHLTEDERG